MGTQSDNNQVRRDYGVDWSNNDPAGNVGGIGYPVNNNTLIQLSSADWLLLLET